MKKALIILNEEISSMALGRNSSLSFILSAHSLGYEVFLWNLSNNFDSDINEFGEISVSYFNQDKNLADNLVTIYGQENQKIFNKILQNSSEEILQIPALKIAEIEQKKLTKITKLISEFDLVIQRLEPMKQPFPPVGKISVDEVIQKLKKLLPNHKFNCPISLNDKDAPKNIDEFLAKKISTPTANFVLDFVPQESISIQCQWAIEQYQNLYKNSKNQQAKIVFKPKDAAQSLGVFAVNFIENGPSCEEILNENFSTLKGRQIFDLSNKIEALELDRIIKVFCFLQNCGDEFFDKKIHQIEPEKIVRIAKELYDPEILIQPFLEGVSLGDIRVNLLKDWQDNFYVAGSCFRKSLRKSDEKKFTTAFSVGGALPLPVSFLTEFEQKNLAESLNKILTIFNSNLKQQYQNIYELGLDFLLVGDGKNIFLGEANHHCVGLLPLSEIMEKTLNQKAAYEFGMALSKRAILDLARN